MITHIADGREESFPGRRKDKHLSQAAENPDQEKKAQAGPDERAEKAIDEFIPHPPSSTP